MKRKIGVFCMVLGVLLVLGALGLFLYNQREAESAGKVSSNILSELQAVVDTQRTDKTPNKYPQRGQEQDDLPTEITPIPDGQITEMSTVEIDGYDFIGYLSIPDLDLELPVMAEWDYTRLKIAPCRQYGSINGNDMVIAAHNYKQHFGRLNDLGIGASVCFTDMDGIITEYSVQNTEILQPTDVSDVENSIYDLVLYTCTYGGKERIVVGCNKIDKGVR